MSRKNRKSVRNRPPKTRPENTATTPSPPVSASTTKDLRSLPADPPSEPAPRIGILPRLVAVLFLNSWILSRIKHPEALRIVAEFAKVVGRTSLAEELRARAGLVKSQESAATYTPFQVKEARKHFELGNKLRKEGRLEEAIPAYATALKYMPNLPCALRMMGTSLFEAGETVMAADCLRRAAQLEPDDPDNWLDLGYIQYAAGEIDGAQYSWEKALALNPNSALIHVGLGVLLDDLGRTDVAIHHINEGLRLGPNNPSVHHNLACYHLSRDNGIQALEYQRKVVALDPTAPPGHVNLGMILLILGQFKEGWEESEWRWRTAIGAHTMKARSQPVWDGSPCDGKTILVWAEQGQGDVLQFIRYTSLLAERGARVIAQVYEPLVRLVRTAPGVSEVISMDSPVPAHDLHCPVVSLPRVFGTDLQTIPAQVPYLSAPPDLAAAWSRRIGDDGRLRVGLVWAGNTRTKMARSDAMDRRRSIRFPLLSPILKVPGVRFFSLQMDEAAKQRTQFDIGNAVTDLMADVKDFADTAAIIESLDLVITVDTSVAHLAGALNKPVWVLSRVGGCWRWLLDRTDSPWYPSLRLFRQTTSRNWTDTIAQVAAALAPLAAEKMAGKGRSR